MQAAKDLPDWTVRLLGTVGPTMARSLRLSNRKLREDRVKAMVSERPRGLAGYARRDEGELDGPAAVVLGFTVALHQAVSAVFCDGPTERAFVLVRRSAMHSPILIIVAMLFSIVASAPVYGAQPGTLVASRSDLTGTMPLPLTGERRAAFSRPTSPTRSIASTCRAEVAVVQNGDVVYLNGFGVKKVDSTRPVTPATLNDDRLHHQVDDHHDGWSTYR